MGRREGVGERRKFTRFQVRSPAFVFNSYKVGKIVDVSLNGLAFTYDGSEQWAITVTELDLLIDNEIFLNKVPVKVISDMVVAEEPLRQMVTRQCGVQFGSLTPDQIHYLEYFIRISKQEMDLVVPLKGGVLSSFG